MNTDDLALGYVLGTLEPDDRARAERALAEEPAFADAVARARADMDDITRGLELVASDATKTPRGDSMGRRLAPFLGAAAAVALIVAGIVAVQRGTGDPTVDASQSTIRGQLPGACSLDALTGEFAVAIVTGTVTDVATGTAEQDGGLDYQIATVQVGETIMGDASGTIHAFDYTYGSPWVEEGQELLLFLASSAGTGHAGIDPPHYQVNSGDCGSVEIRDGELVGASFTLQQVREAAR